MKGLYFLKRDHPELNVSYILSSNEVVRDTFDYAGFLQQVFIKGGKPYYLPWDAWQINKFEEFMVRYEEICLSGAYTRLYPSVSGYLIYIEYYSKWLGERTKILYHNYFKLAVYTYDEDLY